MGRRGSGGGAELARELRGDLILQLKDLVQPSIDLGVGERFTADDVDEARRDADAFPIHLETSDRHEANVQGGGDLFERRPGTANRFMDAPAIDDAKAPKRPQ